MKRARVTQKIVLSCLLLVAAWRPASGADYTVEVDCGTDVGPMYPFWQGTGMCDKFNRRVHWQYMNAVPFDNLVFVREHGLLSWIRAKEGTDGTYTYDFTALDANIDQLVKNGLKPIFEMMGNPQLTTDVKYGEGIFAKGDKHLKMGSF